MVVHMFNTSNLEAEASGSPGSRQARTTQGNPVSKKKYVEDSWPIDSSQPHVLLIRTLELTAVIIMPQEWVLHVTLDFFL